MYERHFGLTSRNSRNCAQTTVSKILSITDNKLMGRYSAGLFGLDIFGIGTITLVFIGAIPVVRDELIRWSKGYPSTQKAVF
ncbi:unnamed protein product [Acanthoscelides obtectus]|uniref:Uncharacterized protein n=1 Tax=Acanthoscelides obtectus TaxID=200917 RepID=A0A9P0KU98_ACAOB|nr:unnamed protein product [Acanthoscelides obtectus]CAK1656122.1 hypothetical protein AOBTE_LOCUS19579 [Acanthoscelides obtectus]